MKKILLFFLRINKKTLVGMLLGLISGYLYWLHFGLYWGSYFLSAECWVNCLYGCLLGGFLAIVFTERNKDLSFFETNQKKSG